MPTVFDPYITFLESASTGERVVLIKALKNLMMKSDDTACLDASTRAAKEIKKTYE